MDKWMDRWMWGWKEGKKEDHFVFLAKLSLELF